MATSYSNQGGTGNRQGRIFTSSSPAAGSSNDNLIDGAFGNNSSDSNWWSTGSATGRYIRFDFGAPRVIDEAKWYQSNTTSLGTWKWQGSNNGSSWTDIGSSFTLGGVTTQTQTELNGNTTAYRYYQLLGVSGTYSDSPYIQEVEFKIDDEPYTSYNNPQGRGNRTASITTTASVSPEGGSNANLVNGNYSPNSGGAVWYPSGSASGRWIKFDFATARLITEAIWYQSDSTSHGTWKWQGSNDDSSWVDIGSTFTLGGATSQVFTQLNGNVTGYRYYRLLGVSGSYSNLPFITEIEFKIDNGTPPVIGDITDVTPTEGSKNGGTAVTITGVGFTAATGVLFDTDPADDFVVVNDTTITCTTPAHAVGLVDVTVERPEGDLVATDAFEFIEPQFSIVPISGNIGGGTAVTIYGEGFDDADGVLFDTDPADDFVVVNDTTITCTTPAHAAGLVDVTITFDVEPDVVLEDAYEYVEADAPEIISVVPDNGTMHGGTSVTITGENFTDASSVTFGSEEADDLVVVNDTTITVTTPEHEPGLVDVTVTTPAGSDTLVDGFEFRPPARITQTPLLVIHEPNQSAHVTQIPLLVINLPIQGAKITQTPVLPVWTPTPIPLPLPVLPDVPIIETWEYRTVVTISDRSKEQRSQLRAEPRFNMSFGVTILDDEDRRDVYQMLMKYISSTFSYPMFVYAVKLDSETLVGNSKLFFNPAHTDMRPGEGIVLYNPQTEEMVVKTIQSVESDGAILTEPVEFEVPAWYHVAPAPTFRTAPTVGFQMDSISGSLSLQLHGIYSRAVMRPSQSTGLLTLVDGLLLLDKRPLANGAVDEEFDQNVEWLDNGVAPPEPRTNWYSPFIGGKRSYLVHRPNDLDYWRAVANYLKGRQNPFLLPTFRNDMPLAVTPSLGSTTIVSSNIQFAEFWRSRAWRYLSIQSDAGILYRRINEVITNYDMNGQPISVSIKLASSIGNEAGRNQNMVVSFVNTCRLDGDDIVLEHGYVDTTLTMKIRLVEE